MTTNPSATTNGPSSKAAAVQSDCPQSVSLKIGRTSVMLYANRYRKAADGRPGYSVQEYLCSFSVNSTDIPPEIDALLRQVTCGKPARYRELIERLTYRVLEPARQRLLERQQEQQKQHALALLGFANDQLEHLGLSGVQAAHLADPQVQEALRGVLNNAQSLLTPLKEPSSPPLVCSGSHSPAQLPDEQQLDDAEPEKRLRQLLKQINAASAELAGLMPESARKFRRGHAFEDSTVELVRQLWFRTSDAVAALGGRTQLRRPKQWDHLRGQVMAHLD